MNTNGNTYTFIYASVLVIVFAAILATAALLLQGRQQKNVDIEKKQQILASVNVASSAENADELYEKYIKESFVINTEGNQVDGNAFELDLKKELDKPQQDRKLPLFVAQLEDGTESIIVPLRGKGLWGPIWGYISLKSDYNTIYGATFDHKGETPGLGAEINKDWFSEPFKNKQIFDNSNSLVSINVVKGGAKETDIHGVDAISGGTITSKGLEAMVRDCLMNYETYFKTKKNN